MINPEGSPHFIGMDKFVLFFGIVEDRDDPLMLGRVRVRIFGLHPDDKAILPTEDLPWAFPIMPITSANVSGVGHAPVGLLVGSTVVGFFADGMERQIPMFFGTMSGGTGHFTNGDDSSPDGTSPYNGPINGEVPSNGSIAQKGASMAKIILSRYPALKPHHAAAICGNIGGESGFQVVTQGTRSSTPPSRTAKSVGYGYVQWTGVRLTKFLDWCSANHKDPKTDATNVEYFFYEIDNSKYYSTIVKNLSTNGTVKINEGTWAGVYDCSTPEGATTYWMAAYEGPAKATCHLEKRQKYTKDILTAMNNTGTPVRAAAKLTDGATSSGMFVGDSIAVRVGSAAKVTTNATVGWDSTKILANYGGKYGKDYTVISVGTNDWGTGNWNTTKSNIQKIRAGIKSKKVCWIIPNTKEVPGKNSKQIAGMRKAADIVRSIAGSDTKIELSNYTCSDGLHPDNGGAVWADIKRALGV